MKPKELNISNEKYFGKKINILWKNMEKRKERNPLSYYFILWRGKSNFLENEANEKASQLTMPGKEVAKEMEFWNTVTQL